MRLKDWRLVNDLTLASCAQRLGVHHARNYQKYETGENRPDAPMVDRILGMTNGQVGLEDMHRQRLEWLQENRPANIEAAE